MNINYTETLILNYLLKNQDKNSNEYHIFNDIKSYDISSSDMVAEIIKLKRKRFLEETGDENKSLILTPSGIDYAKRTVRSSLDYIMSLEKAFDDVKPMPVAQVSEATFIEPPLSTNN